MAHKGYTLNYFINFFSNIPSNRFTTCELLSNTGNRMCALGHAGSADRKPSLAGRSTYQVRGLPTEARARALASFLGGASTVARINDGYGPYSGLGKTPRARILRALRNRKSTGNVLGE